MRAKLFSYPALALGFAATAAVPVHFDLFAAPADMASTPAAYGSAVLSDAYGADAPVQVAALPPQDRVSADVNLASRAGFGAGRGLTDADQQIIPLHAVLATGMADSLLEPPAHATIERVALTVSRGDTLMAMITGTGVPGTEAHNAIEALREAYDPRRLQIGQEITLRFAQRGDERVFQGLELVPDVESWVVVSRSGEGFTAAEHATVLETRSMAAAGAIESSLYLAARDAGIPDQVLIALIRAYSFDVDFQRDIQSGDSFELLFEQDYDADGNFARNGNVLHAVLHLSGRELPIYRFETEDGAVDYYDRDGTSVRRALMRTPIDGARLSSRFGMRRHPILGYNRMHRGADFAAPTGTPIYAAGNGVVDAIGPNGGYGKYIRLRHSGSLKTAYAHLSRFARGLNRGDRVEQGEVIGYVGSTGRSTGPHLHYEVLIDGRQVNPLTIDLPSGRTLEGRELAAFQQVVAERDRRYAALIGGVQVAQTPEP